MDSALQLAARDSRHRGEVFRIVSDAAYQWKDADLWCRALDVYNLGDGIMEKIGLDSLVDTILFFEPPGILPRYAAYARPDALVYLI